MELPLDVELKLHFGGAGEVVGVVVPRAEE